MAQLKLSYDIHFASKYFPIGRLAFKVEGGGKTRIFAIPNSFKQALMRPFHDWCMSVLKKMKMDGTYNQLGPLERLKSVKKFDSFYLSSATDRFPLWISYLWCIGSLISLWVRVGRFLVRISLL